MVSPQKETAVITGDDHDGHFQNTKRFKQDTSATVSTNQDIIAAFDDQVMMTLAAPRDNRRNGRLCFTKRSRLARELGCTRDVLNASIRRLTAAKRLRATYLPALGKHGLEIIEPVDGLAVHHE